MYKAALGEEEGQSSLHGDSEPFSAVINQDPANAQFHKPHMQNAFFLFFFFSFFFPSLFSL